MRRAIVLMFLSIVSFEGAVLSQTEADWDWTNKNFGPVLDRLMPLQRAQCRYVVYRANRDLHTEVPEYWFLIGYDGNGNGYGLQPALSAHVRTADGTSIYDQLMRMHQKDRNRKAASMAKNIKLREWDGTETACPGIRKQVEQLQNLQSKPLELNSGVIVLHPMNHQFHIQFPSGDMRFTIWDDEHPLAAWASETRHALETCAKM